jgi:hypothetical protein
VSRPRKPIGSSYPRRLPATMVKVLAAETTDPARLRRGITCSCSCPDDDN